VIKKVRSHPSQKRALLFERSSPGKAPGSFPSWMCPPWTPSVALGAANVRAEIPGFPK